MAAGIDSAVYYTSIAIEEASDELTRLKDETSALREFIGRVGEMEASRPPAQTTPVSCPAVPEQSGGDPLKTVAGVYTDTFLATPHADEDYHQGPVEDMADEFGPEVVLALGNNAQLHTQLKQGVIAAAEQSIKERQAVCTSLREEKASLEESREQVERIEEDMIEAHPPLKAMSPHDETIAEDDPLPDRPASVYTNLDTYRDRCDQILEDRQEHPQAIRHRQDRGPELWEYIYDPMPVTLPVIEDVILLRQEIDGYKEKMGYAVEKVV